MDWEASRRGYVSYVMWAEGRGVGGRGGLWSKGLGFLLLPTFPSSIPFWVDLEKQTGNYPHTLKLSSQTNMARWYLESSKLACCLDLKDSSSRAPSPPAPCLQMWWPVLASVAEAGPDTVNLHQDTETQLSLPLTCGRSWTCFLWDSFAHLMTSVPRI